MKKLNYSTCFILMLISVALWRCAEKKPLVNITGTVISLSPPEGFTEIPQLGGFKHQELKATIMVVELPKAFDVANEQMLQEDSLSSGMKILSREEVRVDGRKGVLLQVNRRNPARSFNQWMLVLPNANYTTSINGTYLAKDEKVLSDQIKEALLTTHIGNNENSLVATLPFELSIEKPTLKLAKVLTGPSVVYTADGVWTEHSLLSTSFYVGQSLRSKMTQPVSKESALGMFARVCPNCKIEDNNLSEVSIDNLKGLELWGYTEQGHKLKYQVVLHDNDHYFQMVGTASEDQDTFLEMFRAASKTFKRKEQAEGTLAEAGQ